MLSLKSTKKEIEDFYSNLGKEGHKIIINLESLTVRLDRISKRSKYGIKNIFKIRFRTKNVLLEHILNYANSFIQDEIKDQRRKEERKIKNQIDRQNVKVNDFFYYYWGFEQTNVNFYKVVDIKGVTATLQEIGSKTVSSTSWASENCIADDTVLIKEPFKVRLTGSSFKRSCGKAYKMENKKTQKYRSWYA